MDCGELLFLGIEPHLTSVLTIDPYGGTIFGMPDGRVSL